MASDIPTLHASGSWEAVHDATINYIHAALRLNAVDSVLIFVGSVTVCLLAAMMLGFVLAGWGQRKRLNSMSQRLVSRSLDELSIGELMEAQSLWPLHFELARFLEEKRRNRLHARAIARLDEWFEKRREEARR